MNTAKNKMDGQTSPNANTTTYPRPLVFPSKSVETEKPKKWRQWIVARFSDVGVITMTASPRKKDWGLNPTNSLGWLGIIAMFCTLSWFIYQRGVEHGQDIQKIEHLTEDVKRAQGTGDKALQIAMPSAKNIGHEDNTNTERKQEAQKNTISHVIIILDEKADCVASKTNQLKDHADELDAILENQIPANSAEIHELLERIQSFFTMVCGSTSLSGGDTLDGLIGEAKGLLQEE